MISHAVTHSMPHAYFLHTSSKTGPGPGVAANFGGSWGPEKLLRQGDPRDLVTQVNLWLHGDASSPLLPPHEYVYVSSANDQNWTTNPNAPSSLVSDCVGDCHARFLLAVERGCFLGSNGYSPDFDLPLGNPHGPAAERRAQWIPRPRTEFFPQRLRRAQQPTRSSPDTKVRGRGIAAALMGKADDHTIFFAAGDAPAPPPTAGPAGPVGC